MGLLIYEVLELISNHGTYELQVIFNWNIVDLLWSCETICVFC